MCTNRSRIFVVTVLLLVLIIPVTGSAVSYQPPLRLIPDSGSEVVKGGTVYLFHSGTRDIVQTIHGGDIFIVYRINSSCKMEEVGAVRFVKFVGEIYLEAEVVRGELKAGDIARLKNISCLVVATEQCAR
jgi:hypothetical protein